MSEPSSETSIPHLLRAVEIAAMAESISVHGLNANAVRHTRSIGDILGMSHLGIHLVRVEPGKDSTQYHFHHYEEEFLYILAGRGMAQIGDREVEVSVGDFMGFTAPSLPHSLYNPFEEDLVYLMGGQRLDFDVADYPKIGKRNFRVKGKRHIVDRENISSF